MYLSTCVDENLRARNPWTREIVLHALHRAYSQQYIVCTKYKYSAMCTALRVYKVEWSDELPLVSTQKKILK